MRRSSADFSLWNMVLPTEVMQLIFENLSLEGISMCSRVCLVWRHVVFSDPLLAARMDVDKAIQIFNTNAHLGVEFITTGIGMINGTEEEIAQWLERPQLNPQQVDGGVGLEREGRACGG